MNTITTPQKLIVPHYIKGQVLEDATVDHGYFMTPALNLDDLVWPRTSPPPAAEVPIEEIYDILVALGDWAARDPDGQLKQAFESSLPLSTLKAGVLERSYRSLSKVFNRRSLEFQVENELGGADILDSWRLINTPSGRACRVRAYPPRLVHIIAGNAAVVSATTLIRAALSKGVHLIKLPSNDLFTMTALLRGLSAVAPNHPLAQSFCTVYWRGGDKNVEAPLFTPLFFDKLVAWGGESTIRNAKDYIGPGFELVAYDPKTSISIIGDEAHVSDDVRNSVAEAAAVDVTVYDQQACCCSRIQFVAGSVEDVDKYCEELCRQIGVERELGSACGFPVTGTIKEEIEALSFMDDYKVFGDFSGKGLVIRSDTPVDFYPDGRIVNVVRLDNIEDAVQYANVATQTVGVYPPELRKQLRNGLASQGVQRIVDIGGAFVGDPGLPHDGSYAISRMIRLVTDEPIA